MPTALDDPLYAVFMRYTLKRAVPRNSLPFTNPSPCEQRFIIINCVEQSEAVLLLRTFQDFFPRDLKTLILITGAAWGMTAAMRESSWE